MVRSPAGAKCTRGVRGHGEPPSLQRWPPRLPAIGRNVDDGPPLVLVLGEENPTSHQAIRVCWIGREKYLIKCVSRVHDADLDVWTDDHLCARPHRRDGDGEPGESTAKALRVKPLSNCDHWVSARFRASQTPLVRRVGISESTSRRGQRQTHVCPIGRQRRRQRRIIGVWVWTRRKHGMLIAPVLADQPPEITKSRSCPVQPKGALAKQHVHLFGCTRPRRRVRGKRVHRRR